MKSLKKENHRQMYFFNIEKPSTVTFFLNVHCTLMQVSHIQWNYFFKNSVSFCFHLPKRPESNKCQLFWVKLYVLTQVLPNAILLGILNDWAIDAFSCFIWCFKKLCESKCLKFTPDIGSTTKIALYVFWYHVDSW